MEAFIKVGYPPMDMAEIV